MACGSVSGVGSEGEMVGAFWAAFDLVAFEPEKLNLWSPFIFLETNSKQQQNNIRRPEKFKN
ncbi:hypothetical protein BpHYR1_026152 [Brachionus plicatilis]|uniref:Uncharacterized protein n=1 Tax=Brachionus plicatilis TaxID=10195 RepID=A0A3M7T752_BRAPC|nr:hypothetical protein BpHYR1_026152 [Brachionus plicatilis]